MNLQTTYLAYRNAVETYEKRKNNRDAKKARGAQLMRDKALSDLNASLDEVLDESVSVGAREHIINVFNKIVTLEHGSEPFLKCINDLEKYIPDFSKHYIDEANATTAHVEQRDLYTQGCVLYHGRGGVTVDYKVAFECFYNAYELGYEPAAAYLASMYHEGTGTAQNYEQALILYRICAETGDALSMRGVGQCYWFGQGVEQSYETAVEWYRKAAASGDVRAMNDLGLAYYNGQGVEKDLVASFEWLKKASESGNISAMRNLGTMYHHGRGTPVSYNKAEEWYTKARDGGNAKADESLSELVADRETEREREENINAEIRKIRALSSDDEGQFGEEEADYIARYKSENANSHDVVYVYRYILKTGITAGLRNYEAVNDMIWASPKVYSTPGRDFDSIFLDSAVSEYRITNDLYNARQKAKALAKMVKLRADATTEGIESLCRTIHEIVTGKPSKFDKAELKGATAEERAEALARKIRAAFDVVFFDATESDSTYSTYAAQYEESNPMDKVIPRTKDDVLRFCKDFGMLGAFGGIKPIDREKAEQYISKAKDEIGSTYAEWMERDCKYVFTHTKRSPHFHQLERELKEYNFKNPGKESYISAVGACMDIIYANENNLGGDLFKLTFKQKTEHLYFARACRDLNLKVIDQLYETIKLAFTYRQQGRELYIQQIILGKTCYDCCGYGPTPSLSGAICNYGVHGTGAFAAFIYPSNRACTSFKQK